MTIPKQDERTPGLRTALKERTELFQLGKDETGGPCFFWDNPWSGAREKIANLWWPAHPSEATADVEALFADLSLQTEADGEHTYELGKRDGYEDAVQTIDVETGGDGEFYGSTIPGRGVDVPTMQENIVNRFEQLKQACNSHTSLTQDVERLRDALAGLLAFDSEAYDRKSHRARALIEAKKKARAALTASTAPSTEGLREWQPIAGAPRDQNIIVAAMNTYSKTWVVGEARWQSDDPDHPDDGDWWWANISPGDYTGDSIFNMNGPVEFWQPLPPAPDAARTAPETDIAKDTGDAS